MRIAHSKGSSRDLSILQDTAAFLTTLHITDLRLRCCLHRLMATLQELLESVADDLDPVIDYKAKLLSCRYRTLNAVKQADKADLERACGLLLGDATVIWKAAGGVSGFVVDLSVCVASMAHSI
ncbi:hypothetical protein ABBQ32_000872 [Trebouxia sp. C0010 RCD-2024]